ncbi:cellulose binding domain-containing protein, partial [Actinoplanes awajinensis]|uniref:cellulose binding domain-containing protein n=1 Tax=Actinoplanes awajinensis TaxID=135946 RepID=UPI000ABB8754
MPAGGTVGSFWDTQMAVSGSHRTFTNSSWNGPILVNGKGTFEFNGLGGHRVTCKLSGQPCGGATDGG